MRRIALCYALTGCTVPAVRVTLSQGGESIELDICPLHIPETRALGFGVKARNGLVIVTSVLPAPMRSVALRIQETIQRGTWTPISSAPNYWCADRCKVEASRTPAGHLTFRVAHNSTYGCAGGAVA